MIILIMMRVAVRSASSFPSWLHISVEHRPVYGLCYPASAAVCD